jgi:hypothetical protein
LQLSSVSFSCDAHAPSNASEAEINAPRATAERVNRSPRSRSAARNPNLVLATPNLVSRTEPSRFKNGTEP